MPLQIDVVAPIPGLVASVLVKPGEAVTEGDPIVMLQSMKTEIPVSADQNGSVIEVLVQEGQEVDIGTVVARLSVS